MTAIPSFVAPTSRIHPPGKDLSPYIKQFVLMRAISVGWDFPASSKVMPYIQEKEIFIGKLKTYPWEQIYQEIKKMLLDDDYAKLCFSTGDSFPYARCYCPFILKERGEVDKIPPTDILPIVKKFLEALEDSYQTYAPERDESLNFHNNDIRREGVSGIVEIVKFLGDSYVHDLVDFLVSTYQEIEIGHGLKHPLLLVGENLGVNKTIISMLAEIAGKTPAEDLDKILSIFLEAVKETFKDLIGIYPLLEKLAEKAASKVPVILIALLKEQEKESSSKLKGAMFDFRPKAQSSIFEIVNKLSPEQKMATIEFLQQIANNESHSDARFASNLLEKFEQNSFENYSVF